MTAVAAGLLKKHWKKLLLVGALVAAFVAGATLNPQPGKVVTVEKIVYVEKKVTDTKVVEVDKTKTDIKINKHVEKTKVTAPDGTITEKEVSDTQAGKTVYVDRVVEKVVKEQVIVEKVVEKEVRVDNLKRFRVGLLVGVQPQILPVPNINSYVVGGTAEIRVVGPVWAGVWGAGTTQGMGMGGIKVAVDF